MKRFLKHAVSLLLVVCLIAALGCTAFAIEAEQDTIPFTDVSEDSWYYHDVYTAYHLGLMNGMTDTTFAPEETMTRAMLVMVLYRIAGEDPEAVYPSSNFADVPANTWYTQAVNWAADCGIAFGTDPEHFRPNESVNRQQAVTFFFRLASNYCWKSLMGDTEVPWDNSHRADLSKYVDCSHVQEYAVEAFQWAVANSIVDGIPSDDSATLSPSNSATRAQLSAIAVRFEAHINSMINL